MFETQFGFNFSNKWGFLKLWSLVNIKFGLSERRFQKISVRIAFGWDLIFAYKPNFRPRAVFELFLVEWFSMIRFSECFSEAEWSIRSSKMHGFNFFWMRLCWLFSEILLLWSCYDFITRRKLLFKVLRLHRNRKATWGEKQTFWWGQLCKIFKINFAQKIEFC